MPEEYKSRIEELKKRLYSRTNKPKDPVFTDLKQKSFDVKDDWSYSDGTANQAKENILINNIDDMTKKKQHSFLNKILTVSVIFFVIAVVYALFSFGVGRGVISSDNIVIKVSGPVSISAGEPLSLELAIKNNNNVDLELADLLVEYPEGTRDALDLSKELKRHRESLGTIKSGDTATVVIDSVLFGEEGDKRIISIGLEYRVPGSNAIFFTEKKYEVEIISSPLSMTVDSPTNVNSGEEIKFVLTITPNSSEKIDKILVVAEYPFGFQYNDKTGTKTSFDNNVWEINNLTPGSKEKIIIHGTMLGQNAEERTFRFIVGLPKEFDEKVIGTPFLTHSRSISIEKSFIGLQLALNNSSSDNVTVSIGEDIQGDLTWQNNLTSKVKNVQLEVSLKGEMLDRKSVSAGNGFFRSTDDTIVWDSRAISTFASMDAKTSGSTGFSFEPIDLSKAAGLFKNPTITLIAKISGDTMDDSGVPQRLVTTLSKSVTIATQMNLSSRAYYFSGPFVNSGPLPPKVNQETTYTVVFSISNALNKITGTRVSATLPAYARWMGVVSPTTENVKYNPVSGEITWEAGDVSAGVGYSNPSRDVYFQIAITPGLSQVGTTPVLIINPQMNARDVVTDTQMTSDVAGEVTIQTKSDSGFKLEYAKVVE